MECSEVEVDVVKMEAPIPSISQSHCVVPDTETEIGLPSFMGAYNESVTDMGRHSHLQDVTFTAPIDNAAIITEDDPGFLSGKDPLECDDDEELESVTDIKFAPSSTTHFYDERVYQEEIVEIEAIVNGTETVKREGILPHSLRTDNNETLRVTATSTQRPPKLKQIKTAICSKCNMGFPSPDLYEHHMSQVHYDERPYPCRTCGKPFARSGERKKHESIHDPSRFDGEPKFPCNICGKRYYIKGSMEIHRKKKHFGYKPPKRSHRAPIIEHHSTSGVKNPNPYRKPKEEFPCQHCDLKFPMKCMLQKHMLCHTKEKPFSCPICQQPFPRETQVKSHIRSVHQKSTPTGMCHPRPKWQARQPCPCEVCGKVFTVPSQLRYHMSLHTGERPHQCSTCGERFRMKQTLNHHIKRNHSPQLASNPLKLYKCILCGKTDILVFGDLRRHRITHHGHIPYESEKEKPFGCVICEKPHFLRESAIICALLGHDPSSLLEDMFKFKCPECPSGTFGYRNLSVLRKHWNEDHSEKSLPVNLRIGMYCQNLLEDQLPSCRIDKKKMQEWKMEGIPPEELSKFDGGRLYIEFPPLPIPEDQIYKPKERKKYKRTPRWRETKHFVCDICGLKVSCRSNLKRHKRVVHDSARLLIKKEKFPIQDKGSINYYPYQCSLCDKRFGKMKTLRLHEKSHAKIQVGRGRPPKNPSDASKSMTTVGDMTIIKQEFEDTDTSSDFQSCGLGDPFDSIPESRMFRCRFCCRKFVKVRALRIHELRAHLKPWSTSKHKNANCVTEDVDKKMDSDNGVVVEDFAPRLSSTVNVDNAAAVARLLRYQTVCVTLARVNIEQSLDTTTTRNNEATETEGTVEQNKNCGNENDRDVDEEAGIQDDKYDWDRIAAAIFGNKTLKIILRRVDE